MLCNVDWYFPTFRESLPVAPSRVKLVKVVPKCRYLPKNAADPKNSDGLTAQQFWRLKADSHIARRAHAVPLPCYAPKGLECDFPICFTQCGRV